MRICPVSSMVHARRNERVSEMEVVPRISPKSGTTSHLASFLLGLFWSDTSLRFLMDDNNCSVWLDRVFKALKKIVNVVVKL